MFVVLLFPFEKIWPRTSLAYMFTCFCWLCMLWQVSRSHFWSLEFKGLLLQPVSSLTNYRQTVFAYGVWYLKRLFLELWVKISEFVWREMSAILNVFWSPLLSFHYYMETIHYMKIHQQVKCPFCRHSFLYTKEKLVLFIHTPYKIQEKNHNFSWKRYNQ